MYLDPQLFCILTILQVNGLAVYVTAFDEVIEGALKVFMEASATLGQEVAQIAPKVEQAFRQVQQTNQESEIERQTNQETEIERQTNQKRDRNIDQ